MISQKKSRHDPGGPLISIGEAVVARQTIGIGRCQSCNVRISIHSKILWARHCRFNGASIPYPG